MRQIYTADGYLGEEEAGASRRLVGLAVSQVTRLLLGINVPDDIVGQTIYFVTSALRHLGESLGFGLVLESVRGEVDS